MYGSTPVSSACSFWSFSHAFRIARLQRRPCHQVARSIDHSSYHNASNFENDYDQLNDNGSKR